MLNDRQTSALRRQVEKVQWLKESYGFTDATASILALADQVQSVSEAAWLGCNLLESLGQCTSSDLSAIASQIEAARGGKRVRR